MKKGVLSCLLIFVFTLSFGGVSAAPENLFSDDFQSYQAGQTIDTTKWTIEKVNWVPEAAVDPTDTSAKNQLLKIYRDTAQSGNDAISADLGTQTNLVEISYRYYAPTDITGYNQSGNKSSYFIVNNSRGQNVFYLGMDYGIGSNQRLRISGDESELFLYPLGEKANNTWHDIKVLLNPTDKIYTFYLDDEMKGTYPFRSLATLSAFDVRTVKVYPDRAQTANMLYIDDVYAQSLAYSEGIQVDYDWLQFSDLSAVTENMLLPERGGVYASKIEWSSSNPSVISKDGTVTRQQVDTDVTLTADLTLGGETRQKTFQATVKALESGDDLLRLLQRSLHTSMLTDEASHAITKDLDLSLPEFSQYSGLLNINWTSNSGSVVVDPSAKKAVVTRQAQDTPFTLTAEISTDGATAPVTKSLDFVLWSSDSEPSLTETFSYPNAIGQTIVNATGNKSWRFDAAGELLKATSTIEQDELDARNYLLLSKRVIADAKTNNYTNYDFPSAQQLRNKSVVEAKMMFMHNEEALTNVRYCFDLTARGILPSGAQSSLQAPVSLSFDYQRGIIWAPKVDPDNPTTTLATEKAEISDKLPPADEWFTMKIIIDTPREAWDLYINGEKLNSEPLPFMTTGSKAPNLEGVTYPTLSAMRFGPIRQSSGTNFYIDDLTVRNIADPTYDVELAADQLKVPAKANENLTLPVTGMFDATIKWESSDEGVLSSAGVVKRPVGWEDANIKLTATIQKGDIQTKREFHVIVEKLFPTEIQSVIFKDSKGNITYSITNGGLLDRILLKNNAAVSGVVVAAVYNGDALSAVKKLPNANGLVDIGLELPQDVSNCKIKIFVWENMSEMKPRAIPFVLSSVPADTAKIKIYTVGDSTMATAAGAQAGWGEVLGTYFDPEKAEVDNSFSVGGASSKSTADSGRLNAMLSELKPGDYVIIQFGHNDQKTTEPHNYTSPEDGGTYQQYLKRYIDGVRAKGAYPILATSICRRAFTNGIFSNSLGDYPRSMRTLAEQMQIPLLDLNAKTEDDLIAIGEQESAKYFMVSNNDNTHLTETGARWICFLAIDEMERIGLPLVNYLNQ